MTVKQLRKAIEKLPDDMPVVVSAEDHHYRAADAVKRKAVDEGDSGRWEPRYSEDPCDGTPTLDVLLVS